MVVQYSFSQLTLNIPYELRPAIDEGSWVYVVNELRKRHDEANFWGACYCCLCSFLLFPIGILFGLCCWPMLTHSHISAHCPIACMNANNIYYGGRVIFEWKNEQQVLNVYPENLTTTIVITEPAYGSGNIQQVLLPNGQMGYVQQQTSVPVMATAAYAPPQAQPPVIVVNGDANNPMQQKDSNGSNAV